jgi:hypothetical protein
MTIAEDDQTRDFLSISLPQRGGPNLTQNLLAFSRPDHERQADRYQ